MDDSDFYRRNLPHWQPSNAEYFVTFRLDGSLPKSVINQLKKERELLKNEEDTNALTLKGKKLRKRIFKKYEEILDSGNFGPTWLANPAIARIVHEALLYRDKHKYDLYCFCIMPNHVHTVFKLLEYDNSRFPVTEIFKNLKSFTALKTNKILERSGSFWQSESYDHVIRDAEELENTIYYTLNNPVKAGLASRWSDWKFSYCKPAFSG